MPLLPTTALPTAQSAAVGQLFKLLAGDVSALPTGQAIPATVVKATPSETVLAVAGQQLTVKGAVNVPAGETVSVRVQPGAVAVVTTQPTSPPVPDSDLLARRASEGQASSGPEVVARQRTTDLRREHASVPAERSHARGEEAVGRGVRSETVSATPTQPAPVSVRGYPTRPTAAPEPAIVDVIARESNGTLRVKIDGREATATSPHPLPPGRHVVTLDRTPAGLVLRPLPDSPVLPATVATAILRTDKPPPLGESLPNLVKELSSPPAEPKTQQAAAVVKEVAVKLLPSPDEPPTAERIKQLVEDGGTHFEAKLARAVEDPHAEKPAPHTDLKSGLISLARTVSDLSAAFPAAAATLDGIERQQAVNVLAQQNGGMAVFQIPFPDGPHWRTLGLGIEPDRASTPDAAGRPTGFRVMMHVPLSGLGETWIDASAEASRLRAVLYVSDAAARDRVRAELGDLRTELRAGGFGEVLLDVRPAADLTESQRRTANAIREGVPAGGGLLDVRA